MASDEKRLCRTCAHWRPLFTGEAWGVRSLIDAPPEARVGVRLDLSDNKYHAKMDWMEAGDCALTDMENEAPTLAQAIDGSVYYAVLRCHGNFGCVQWAPYVAGESP